MDTSAKNSDGSIAVVIFNEGGENKHFSLTLGDGIANVQSKRQPIQTIIITD